MEILPESSHLGFPLVPQGLLWCRLPLSPLSQRPQLSSGRCPLGPQSRMLAYLFPVFCSFAQAVSFVSYLPSCTGEPRFLATKDTVGAGKALPKRPTKAPFQVRNLHRTALNDMGLRPNWEDLQLLIRRFHPALIYLGDDGTHLIPRQSLMLTGELRQLVVLWPTPLQRYSLTFRDLPCGLMLSVICWKLRRLSNKIFRCLGARIIICSSA